MAPMMARMTRATMPLVVLLPLSMYSCSLIRCTGVTSLTSPLRESTSRFVVSVVRNFDVLGRIPIWTRIKLHQSPVTAIASIRVACTLTVENGEGSSLWPRVALNKWVITRFCVIPTFLTWPTIKSRFFWRNLLFRYCRISSFLCRSLGSGGFLSCR